MDPTVLTEGRGGRKGKKKAGKPSLPIDGPIRNQPDDGLHSFVANVTPILLAFISVD